MGDEDVQTVTCDQANNVCTITVAAPGFALVFLKEGAHTEGDGAPSTTFETTAVTRRVNTATVDQAVLATSNGHGGWDEDKMSSTSKGSQSGALTLDVAVGLVTLIVSACVLLLTN